jgi:hypothetical protein
MVQLVLNVKPVGSTGFIVHADGVAVQTDV